MLAELEGLETETKTDPVPVPEPENKVQQATKLKKDLKINITTITDKIENFTTEYTKHKESFENNKLMQTKIKQEADKKTKVSDKKQAGIKLKTEYLLLINEKQTLLDTIEKIYKLFTKIVNMKHTLTNIMQSIILPNKKTLFADINRDIDNIKIQSINDFKNEILTEIKKIRNEIEIKKAIAESFLNKQKTQRKNAENAIRNINTMLRGISAIRQGRK